MPEESFPTFRKVEPVTRATWAMCRAVNALSDYAADHKTDSAAYTIEWIAGQLRLLATQLDNINKGETE